jgi:hypothetical protein
MESIQSYFTDLNNFKKITLGCLELLINKDKYKPNEIHDVEYNDNIIDTYRELTKDFPKYRDVSRVHNQDPVIVWIYGNKESVLRFAKQLDTEENTCVITGNSLRIYEHERTCIIPNFNISTKSNFVLSNFFDSSKPFHNTGKNFNSRTIYILSHKHIDNYVRERTLYINIDLCIEINGGKVKVISLPFQTNASTNERIRTIFDAYYPTLNSLHLKTASVKRMMIREVSSKTIVDDIIYLEKNINKLYFEDVDVNNVKCVIKTYIQDLVNVETGGRSANISNVDTIYKKDYKKGYTSLIPIQYRTSVGTIVDLTKYCCVVDDYSRDVYSRVYTIKRLYKLIKN